MLSDELLCEELSKRARELIFHDGLVLLKLVQEIQDGFFCLSWIPFAALYCKSAKELLDLSTTNKEIEQEVNDIRNGIKIFTEKFRKSKKMAVESDFHQDRLFSRTNLFYYERRYYNLGIYFTEDRKVIGNTHLMDYYLNNKESEDLQELEKRAFYLGKGLASEIAIILENLNSYYRCDFNKIEINSLPKIGYIDFNTNHDVVGFNELYTKDFNLILLHMLSAVGFINNVLIPVFKNKNIWALRILYITVHNTIQALKKNKHRILVEGMNSNELDDILNHSKEILSSSFRNCMMHYGLVDKNNCATVLKEFYNIKVPYYGLIESCFNEVGFMEYFSKLENFSRCIEKYLQSLLLIDDTNICFDW